MTKYRTIVESDVGKPVITAFGRKWRTEEFIGQVLPQDVGKRIYQSDDILQVENREQFEARKRRDA